MTIYASANTSATPILSSSNNLYSTQHQHQHPTINISDGELSGAQIDGNLAAQKILESDSNPIIKLVTKMMSNFYTNMVETGDPNSWPIRLWTTLSRNTILKEKLVEFFDSSTDFSKRLVRII